MSMSLRAKLKDLNGQVDPAFGFFSPFGVDLRGGPRSSTTRPSKNLLLDRPGWRLFFFAINATSCHLYLTPKFQDHAIPVFDTVVHG